MSARPQPITIGTQWVDTTLIPMRDETQKNGQVVKEKIEIKGGRSGCTVAAIRTEVDQRGRLTGKERERGEGESKEERTRTRTILDERLKRLILRLLSSMAKR